MTEPGKSSILIIDDDPAVCFVLERTLRGEGYRIDSITDGAKALETVTQERYDLILLDLNMQPLDGIQILAELRRKDPEALVIILTGHGSLDTAVDALRLGAFDYLFKPAQTETIRQRVREGLQQRQKIIRRQKLLAQIEGLRKTLADLEADNGGAGREPDTGQFQQAGKLVIDYRHREVLLDSRVLELTTAEFDVLACLVKAAPQIISARDLVKTALGYESEESEAREIIKWHIHRLRQKIEQNPLDPQFIKTIRYKGYLWSG